MLTYDHDRQLVVISRSPYTAGDKALPVAIFTNRLLLLLTDLLTRDLQLVLTNVDA